MSRAISLLQILREIMTLAVVPLLGWMLVQAVEIQKDIVELRGQISMVVAEVKDHRMDSEQYKVSNSQIHHRPSVRMCDGCHK